MAKGAAIVFVLAVTAGQLGAQRGAPAIVAARAAEPRIDSPAPRMPAGDHGSADRRSVRTRVIVLAPKAADKADTTHAALLLSRQTFAVPFTFAGRVATVRQLRVGSPPNPWECAWLVWDYRDQQHFYYLAIKPNGWELGKRDPAYPGGQRFLASGEASFPIGGWHQFEIRQARNEERNQERDVITVRLDGVEIVSYVDGERPYVAGGLGLYGEDAEVQLDDVTAPFADDFEDYPLLHDTAEGRVINNWTAPFLGYGYVAVIERKR
ncbi:MAG TPA: hypothetical protein VLX44_15040 [Xanthobacteraceae bacterium]|nr:hypothetical protein [Xanthobacteraceae bacterium]